MSAVASKFLIIIQYIASQDISVVLAVMDQDRHCGSVEMGRATITLKVQLDNVLKYFTINTNQGSEANCRGSCQVLLSLSTCL